MLKGRIKTHLILVFMLLILLTGTSYSLLYTAVENNQSEITKKHLQQVPIHLQKLKECLQNWEDNPDDDGLLASSSSLTPETCRRYCTGELAQCDYDLTTGKICIKTSSNHYLEHIKDKVFICTPKIDSSTNEVSFLHCDGKHNISYMGLNNSVLDGEMNPLIEDVGIVNFIYDSTITSCD